MIAQDFARLRVRATESIAVAMVEGARTRRRAKDQRGRGQRSLCPAGRLKMVGNPFKVKDIKLLDKRLGEICGLEQIRSRRASSAVPGPRAGGDRPCGVTNPLAPRTDEDATVLKSGRGSSQEQMACGYP